MKIKVVDVSQEQIEEALKQAKAALPPTVFEKIENVVRAYSTLLKILENKNTTIGRLRRMLFGSSSEKSSRVLARQEQSQAPGEEKPKEGGNKSGQKKPPQPGHGRNGQDAYWGAKTKDVPHHKFKSGDRCPGCRKGKVYEQGERPGTLVRVSGQPPLDATIYRLQKLRCNLCQEIFQARPPKGVGKQKYNEPAASMIGLLKYGGGFPWNRLDKLQGAMGIPLPSSTQWDIVRDAARKIQPAYDELVRQAAQGKVLHNDDTGMKILAWMGKRREASLLELAKTADKDENPGPERTGIFTSGIISEVKERQIALFFTGRRHAGENLNALLDKRDPSLRPPIQMSDALSRNIPGNFKTVLANCLTHGRRKFVDVMENFPRECEHVLGIIAEIYKNDAIAKKQKMTDAARLKFHQKQSAPLMKKLRAWMQERVAQKKVEPNSGLGEAIGYMIKHWEKLTLFLKKAGAPLDNNICERALKKAILHRKNALFYKTDNGARVGDIYMSLIHTCGLCGADPFDYLTQLQRHAKKLRAQPEKWMPWNYQKVLPRAGSP